MAQLLDLPDEMLLGVLSVVDHEDIEAFTSCCKRLNGVGRDIREQHFARKHHYGTIVCGDTYAGGTPTTHPLQILQDLMQDEVSFLYTTKLILLNRSGDYTDHQVMHWHDKVLKNAYEKIVEEMEGPMSEVLSRSPYLDFRDATLKQDLDSILAGDMALLLTLLPNMESIEMRFYTGSLGLMSSVWYMMLPK